MDIVHKPKRIRKCSLLLWHPFETCPAFPSTKLCHSLNFIRSSSPSMLYGVHSSEHHTFAIRVWNVERKEHTHKKFLLDLWLFMEQNDEHETFFIFNSSNNHPLNKNCCPCHTITKHETKLYICFSKENNNNNESWI